MAPLTDEARLTLLIITDDAALVDAVAAVLSRPADPIGIVTLSSVDAALGDLAGADAILVDAATVPSSDALRLLKHRAASVPLIALLDAAPDGQPPQLAGAVNGVILRAELATELRATIAQVRTKRGLVEGVANRIAGTARTAAPMGEAAFDTAASLDALARQTSLAVEQPASGLGLNEPAHTDRSADSANEPGPRRFLRGLILSSAVPSNGHCHTHRTACALNCGTHFCGLSVTVRDDRIVKIEPADFPDERYRRICLKGISYVQMTSHPARLLTPLKRIGPRGSGEFQPVTWDDALDDIVARMGRLAEDYGPESLMFFAYSGQLSALNGMGGVYHRLASALGASATDLNSFGLDSAIPSGIEDTFGAGSGYLANDYADLPNSRLVLIWGSNPVYSRMNWWSFFAEAQRSGTHLIAIDPRFTATASKSDDWLPVAPGTDLYLALALLREIIARGWIDRAATVRHTVAPLLVRDDTGQYLRDSFGRALAWDEQIGQPTPADQATAPALEGQFVVGDVACRPAFTLLREMVAPYTLEMVAAKTGLPAARIAALAEQYATTRPARIYTLYGIDRWYHGATFGRLIATLAALTGNVGMAGGGAGVDGFCDTPLFLSQYAAPAGKHYRPVNPSALPAQILSEQPHPIKMVWVAFSNWLNQWPDQTRLHNEILPKLDLFVVADTFLTETARWADYVLPAAAIFEREDMVRGPGPFVQYQPRMIAPPGAARSDFDIVQTVAEKLGLGDTFAGEPAEYLAQILAESPGTGTLSFEALRQTGVIERPWDQAQQIAHYERRFNTPTGRIEFYVERMVPYHRALPDYEPPVEADPESKLRERFPLVCITEHSRYRVHSTFVNAPWLREIEKEPHALLHPSEAEVRAIEPEDLVRVYNARGYVVLRAQLEESVPPGTVYFTQGWQTEDFRAGHPQTLTHNCSNPHNALGPNSAFSDVLVEIVRESAKEPADGTP